MIRRTSCEVLLCAPVYYAAGITAFDAWNCRADVACVGADLRVRPQNRLRSGEDGRTHRSAPTVGTPTPPSGLPEEKSTELAKREKLRILLAYELRKQVATHQYVESCFMRFAKLNRRDTFCQFVFYL